MSQVEYWIKHIADEHTAQSISEESHDYAWEIAKLGEEIPYHAIFAARIRDPEGEELKFSGASYNKCFSTIPFIWCGLCGGADPGDRVRCAAP